MRALVIAGTGFIGKFVSRLLVEHGCAVSVLHRGRVDFGTVILGAASITNSEPLASPAALRAGLAANPDIVIHMLAMTERDATAAYDVFRDRIGRLVCISSGDVYRAYGRFTKLEPGPPDPVPLKAMSSPLRSVLYPYRKPETPKDSLEYDYDKVPVERTFLRELSATCLRLPKVYGKSNNADFATVHRFANHPSWRWTHGYVENVAAAIVLAATHPAAAGKIYNVGEEITPTVAERLRDLPASAIGPATDAPYDFAQDIVYDTTPIRTELGYVEPVSYLDGIRRTVE
jgi:nucleoside-diphosphate-sugar epimerase